MKWRKLATNAGGTWLSIENAEAYGVFLPVGPGKRLQYKAKCIFSDYGRGLETTRDVWVYDFEVEPLRRKVLRHVENYNAEVDRYRRAGAPDDLDSFVSVDDRNIKWSSRLKDGLRRLQVAKFEESYVRTAPLSPIHQLQCFL